VHRGADVYGASIATRRPPRKRPPARRLKPPAMATKAAQAAYAELHQPAEAGFVVLARPLTGRAALHNREPTTRE